MRFVSAALLILSLLQGCVDTKCAEPRALIEDKILRKKVLEWVDKKIFSRTYRSSELIRGNHGPYPSPGELRPPLANELLPEFLGNFKIRLVGPNVKEINMVFIRRDTFHGLLVARGDFSESLKSTALKESQFELIDERLGLLCIRRFK